ncbi:MAG: NYN domain-containing protein [Candidatus Giovannonibacteria bacterium]|nr:NYN domain-containing protein [Candidatus Giovannonibacteria bacterium]
MNESETRAEYIDPKLKASGWGEVEGSKIRREFQITDGRIQVGGKRTKPEIADYVLDGKHKFFTYLKKGLGFIVRKKELKRISVIGESGESIIEKGNMDVEITIDAMHNIQKYNIAVFFSGDADFLALVNYLKNGGKKVYIFSSKDNISHELKTGGDGYFDLKDIHEFWGKDLKHRANA